MVKLDSCVGTCNTLNNLSNKVCAPNKTGINESKILTYANVNADLMKQNVIQINDGITINVDVNVKNVMYVKKTMFEILHVIMKMVNI